MKTTEGLPVEQRMRVALLLLGVCEVDAAFKPNSELAKALDRAIEMELEVSNLPHPQQKDAP